MTWILFVVLVFGLCHGQRDFGHDKRGDYGMGFRLEEKRYNKCDDSKIMVDRDNEEHIYAPCKIDDIYCIRHFFVTYGRCIAKHDRYKEYDYEAVFREKQTLHLSHYGVTVVLLDSRISGLNGVIKKFYVNKKTNNLVMAVEFDKVIVDTEHAHYQFQRTGKEPVIISDAANVTYSVTVTAIIPIHNGLSVKESSISFSMSKCKDTFMGPKVSESKDQDVSRLYSGMMADIPTSCEEALLTEAPNFFFSYLQKYICDFGIAVSE